VTRRLPPWREASRESSIPAADAVSSPEGNTFRTRYRKVRTPRRGRRSSLGGTGRFHIWPVVVCCTRRAQNRESMSQALERIRQCVHVLHRKSLGCSLPTPGIGSTFKRYLRNCCHPCLFELGLLFAGLNAAPGIRDAVSLSWKIPHSQWVLVALAATAGSLGATMPEGPVCTSRFSSIPRLGEKTLLEGSIVRKWGVYSQ